MSVVTGKRISMFMSCTCLSSAFSNCAYEAPDAGYTVWWDDEDGKDRVDLTEPGALYDYLVEYAAPEGVQEDEL